LSYAPRVRRRFYSRQAPGRRCSGDLRSSDIRRGSSPKGTDTCLAAATDMAGAAQRALVPNSIRTPQSDQPARSAPRIPRGKATKSRASPRTYAVEIRRFSTDQVGERPLYLVFFMCAGRGLQFPLA